ncbi:hypothetical protein F5883DRAFT_641796 [Diaporthe sp. PMI_573]|nr:hypothetical protein F5883DRAFT_641796 [Diaporthaceae sp. PMI_573]
MPTFNNTPVADRAAIAARGFSDFASDHPVTTASTTVAIILIAGFIILFLIFTGIEEGMSPRGSPSTPSRRVHGNDEVGSHALNPLTPQRSGERQYSRQVENRASGGAVSGGRSVAPWPLAVPAPVLTRTTERQEESSPPPPPYTALPKYNS